MLERHARKTNAAVRSWLASRPGGRSFLWVHYFDPHHPYAPAGSYQMTFAGRLVPPAERLYPANTHAEGAGRPAPVPDAAAVATMKDLYDAEVRYTDDALAELLAMLAAAGILDDAVIAVVADHGESLGEGGYYFGHWDVQWETARVPLVLVHPRGRFAGRRVADLVRTVDLLPTLLAWVGIEAPDDLDGVDLSALLEGRGGGPEIAYSEQRESSPVSAVRTRDWLLERRDPARADASAPARIRLQRRVDGRATPDDVAALHPDVRDALAARLDALRDVPDAAVAVPIPVPEAVREQLRALGYLDDE
jgi:arylsulfatase A-like enzyme